jgi:hypothetical protein
LVMRMGGETGLVMRRGVGAVCACSKLDGPALPTDPDPDPDPLEPGSGSAIDDAAAGFRAGIGLVLLVVLLPGLEWLKAALLTVPVPPPLGMGSDD